ncbi:MAG: ATP-binding protein [Myxococcales bacterium]|nr:ATP-binding protein [Myxococcales bacterium]
MARRVQAADDLVEELVHQFSDPFAFYRELIQNSIDAGSKRVEVTLAFKPASEKGLCTASVADWGEGMDRRIIEDYLLTKFRSTKENDLTKIGKFGIGFVSIFASSPDLVVVDTGRDAEYWRVIFRKDRSYELLRSQEPFEGTRVALHKEMSSAEYQDFVAKSFGAVCRWCRHSEAEVRFAAGGADGTPPGPPASVREPLAVDAPFQVEYQEEGTHIVAGPSRTDPPEVGMYNRGLTLREVRANLFPGVAVKIVSRYLEHTLTRDNVRTDKHYEDAIELVRRLVYGPLRQRLPEELRRAAERPDGSADWQVMLKVLLSYGDRLDLGKLWLRLPGGGAAAAREVRSLSKQAGALVVAPADDVLVARMRSQEMAVLEGAPGEPTVGRVQRLLGFDQAMLAGQLFTFAEAVPEDLRAFLAALAPLLEAAGACTGEAAVGAVHGAGKDRPCLAVEALGRPLLSREAFRSPFRAGAPPILCLNRGHPLIAPLLELAPKSPRLAALLAARLVAATHEALNERADGRLTELALSA